MNKPWIYIASLLLVFSIILGIIGSGFHALVFYSPIISFCSKFFPITYTFQSIWLLFSLTIFVLLSSIWVFLLFLSSYKYGMLEKQHIKLSKEIISLLKFYNISTKNVVYLNTAKHIAMCYGFFSPKIYLSKGLFKDLGIKEFEAVLLHEKYHMDMRHNIGNLVVQYISSVLFFIPLVKEIQKKYTFCIEHLADEYVIQTQMSSKHIKRALVTFIQSNENVMVYSSFSMNIMERRVEKLVQYSQQNKHSFHVKQWISTLFSIGIFLVVFSPVLVFSATMHLAKEVSPKCTGYENCGNICQQIENLTAYTPSNFSQKLFSAN